MKKSKKIIVFITLLILVIVVTPNFSKGSAPLENPRSNDVIENPSAFKPGSISQEDTDTIISKANRILGVITTVGVVVSAVTTLILGIKFMMGSVQEKAEYKKSMVPYLIGVILLFSTSIIVKIIASLVLGTDVSKSSL